MGSGRTGLSAGATIQALNGCMLVLPEGNSTPVYILMKKHNFARFDDSLPSLWRQVTLRRTEFRQTSHIEHHDHERDRKIGSSSVSHQSYPTATMIETSAPPVRDQWRVAPALTAVGTLSPRTSWYWPLDFRGDCSRLRLRRVRRIYVRTLAAFQRVCRRMDATLLLRFVHGQLLRQSLTASGRKWAEFDLL